MSGRAFVFGDNIDTDLMLPGRSGLDLLRDLGLEL